MDNELVGLLGVWLMGSVAVGYVAQQRGRSAVTWVAMSLLISPLLALIALLATSRR